MYDGGVEPPSKTCKATAEKHNAAGKSKASRYHRTPTRHFSSRRTNPERECPIVHSRHNYRREARCESPEDQKQSRRPERYQCLVRNGDWYPKRPGDHQRRRIEREKSTLSTDRSQPSCAAARFSSQCRSRFEFTRTQLTLYHCLTQNLLLDPRAHPSTTCRPRGRRVLDFVLLHSYKKQQS